MHFLARPRAAVVCLIFLTLCGALSAVVYPVLAGEPLEPVAHPKTRDPWLWPFASDSIWNMPIGSDAVYLPAGLRPAKHVGTDYERFFKVKQSDPVQPIYPPSSWAKRWPGDQKRKLGEMQVPDDLIIPDAEGGHTPNECTAFLMPDGRTVKQLEPTCRVEKGAHIVGWLRDNQDLYGPGRLGTHWGSGLSTLGGSIRLGELIAPEPIRHAIKINVWGEQLFYDATAKGFRWPADTADGYAEKAYKGKNPRLVMGTLLALKPDLTPEKLGIKTAPARKLFYAMQDYGAYISDDSAWDDYDFCVELGVAEEVKKETGVEIGSFDNEYHKNIMSIITNLSIVDNNRPDNIGGGGKPRRPLAPPIHRPQTIVPMGSEFIRVILSSLYTLANVAGDGELHDGENPDEPSR